LSKIVDRTLDVFEMFAAEKRRLSLTDMSRILAIPISSCHDVVRALEARGYIYEAAPRAGYYPTRRLLGICETISAHDSLVQRAEPLLQRLKEKLEETITLAKATGMRISYLLVAEPRHPIRYSVTVGSEIRSMHATSAGKAFLSTLPEADLKAFLKSAELKRLTPRTITGKSQLLADIRRSRQRGWFLNREESLEGVITISCPFTWSLGVYIVTVAGPPARMEKKLERAVKLLIETCRELSDTKSNPATNKRG
jgi:DNA-binding IclR family transcriptional regulator